MIRRITKAVAAIGFGHGISIISNVLLVPLFLRFWTSDLYGEWLVLSSVVAYLSTLDMGMQTYLVNRLTQKHQADDVAGYRDLQHSGLALYLAIATVGTVIVFSLSCAVPLKSWLRLEHTGTWTARIVVTLLGAQLLWALPVNFVSAIY